jgi:superfamily II DNA or RNA helicase
MIGSLFPGKRKTYSIHPKDAPAFCGSVLPILKGYSSCQIDGELEQYEPQPCQIQVYFDRQDQRITAKAQCSYGDLVYNVIEPITVSEMYRDFEKEQVLTDMILQYFPSRDMKTKLFFIPEEDEEAVYALLSQGLMSFQQIGQVFVSESLKRIRIMQAPSIRVGITMKSGLLDVDIQAEQLPLEELEGILEGYRRKKRYFRLPDGSFLQLEDNALSAVAELAEGLEVKGSQLAKGHLQIPGYRSFYLDQILRENGGDIQVNRSRAFKALLREMKNVEDSDFEEPDGLLAQLRPYQKFGYQWMMTLQKLGFGGILADDMGLGKTIQTIAYLLALKEGKARSTSLARAEKREYLGLIICPASLVYNWESEIRKFAPALAVVTVTGTASVRREMIARKEGEILLTSYDLLKRDVEWYRDIRFGTVIIDEAQNIKNYTTQTAKAVKILHSIQRFALTGTPIENSLSELWSIFDFLMPGILNSSRHFRTQYEQPIAAGQDERVSARLKKMIRPYILRRIKSDVLKELPDKIEKVLYCQMGEKQKSLYDANLQKLLIFLKGQSAEEFRTGKLQVLAELTKLRQLCCDPSMVYENYDGESAKLEICMEVVRSGAASGNQMLLFSQFTSALERIGRRLEAEGIPYYILTGGTSKEKRSRMVEDFNRDKTPVFLISLKAGGTGLNLTAASIVIHFDPWWNMAAQSQATDRAHRIGQRQVVTVYQLLTRETLEEKIHELQKKKARLSDEIISEGSIQDTLATKEELFAILDNSL